MVLLEARPRLLEQGQGILMLQVYSDAEGGSSEGYVPQFLWTSLFVVVLHMSFGFFEGLSLLSFCVGRLN